MDINSAQSTISILFHLKMPSLLQGCRNDGGKRGRILPFFYIVPQQFVALQRSSATLNYKKIYSFVDKK